MPAAKQFQNWFILWTAIVFFVVAAFVVLCAFTGSQVALSRRDPLLFLSSRTVFLLAGGLGLATSALLLLLRDAGIRLATIAFVSGNALIYLIGMACYHEPNYLVCPGNLNEWLLVPPKVSSAIAFSLFGCTLAGSIGLLVWSRLMSWRRNRTGTRRASLAQNLPEHLPQPSP